MAGIGRISGAMLASHLDRQGFPLQFVSGADTLLSLDFSTQTLGVNTSVSTETVTINGNLSTSNVLVTANTISAKGIETLYLTGNVHLGSNTTVKLTGGNNLDVIQTDGVGNLIWTNVTSLLGTIDFLQGITINGATISTDVTDGNVTIQGNGTGGVYSPLMYVDTLNASTVTATSLNGPLTGNVTGNLTGTVLTATQPLITSLGTLSSLNVSGNITSPAVNATLHGDVYTNNIYGIDGNLTITPNAGTVLTINTTAAQILPTGNTAQRPPTSAGAFRYNSDLGTPEYYNGSVWTGLSSQITSQTILPDGTSTVYTLDRAATTLGVIVSTNGTLQQPNTAYTVAGTQITFSEFPLITDIIEVRYLASVNSIEENSSVVSSPNVMFGTTSTIVDAFDSSMYRSAKYTISATAANGDVQFTEVFILHDGSSPTIYSTANLNLGIGLVATYTTSMSGVTVRLTATATAPGAKLRLQKTYFSV